MTKKHQILSLGAGVQSTTLALMSALGELPKLELCIFADTKWESREVYAHLKWLTSFLKDHEIPVVTVTAGDLRTEGIQFRQFHATKNGEVKRHASIPMFVKNPDGSQGLIRRQCTSEYKIEPIETYLKRNVLGLKKGQHAPKEVIIDQWRGISLDEVYRLKPSRLKWLEVVYPLVGIPHDYLEKRFTRHDCKRWLKKMFPGRVVPRSACNGCPYHANAEWRRMRDEDPVAWADAVEFDKECRVADKKRQSARGELVGLPYLHRSMVPLDEAPIDDDLGPDLFNAECEGMCGL